jgi:acetate kinase
LGKTPEETNLITAHLGNGCSITAVRAGHSVDTSMGFSPLAGLIMGSRSGDIDPAVPYYLGTQLGMSFAEIDRLLNKDSGLLGIAGSNDLRDLEARIAAGDETAQLAVEMYGYRIRKYLGAYLAALGHADAIVFTAGVGENSSLVREVACRHLEALGIILDSARNSAGAQGAVTEIQSAESSIKVLIIRTDEELEIARQVTALI